MQSKGENMCESKNFSFRFFSVLVCQAALAFLPGCATQGASVSAGLAGGAALGAGVGALADPGEGGAHRVRNILIGTGAGAALGAGAGYLIDEGNESSRKEGIEKGQESEKKELQDHLNSQGAPGPKLVPARTEAVWIPDLVRGNTFVPGHFEYRIIEAARWEN
jgi:hypothetical protein